MPTPSLIIPSAPVYDEGLLYGLNVYGTNFVPEPIPFTRATTATRTNAAGLIELAPYNTFNHSQEFTQALWTKTAISVAENTTAAPDGTLTADTLSVGVDASNQRHRMFQLKGFETGTTYTYSVYLKQNQFRWVQIVSQAAFNAAAWCSFDLQDGVIGNNGGGFISQTITSAGNGWWRISVTATAISTANSDIDIVVPTDGTNTSRYPSWQSLSAVDCYYVWGAQLVEGTDPLPYLKTETRLNRPRVDFSLGGCPNLLLEPQRTNLAPQSSSFDSLSWAKASSSVTANTTSSPGGIVDADTLNSTTTSASIVAQAVTIVSGTTYTLSFYIKQNTQRFVYIRFTSNTTPNNYVSVVFDLQDGTVGQTSLGATSGTLVSATTQSAANGFYRLNLTASINITDGNIGVGFATAKTGNTFNTSGTITSAITNGNSFFVWGAQLEAGAYPTTYIPTTTTSVTRNADSFVESNVFSRGMITAAGGAWFFELRNNLSLTRDAAGSNGMYLSSGNGFNNDGFLIWNWNTTTPLQITKYVSNAFIILHTLPVGTCKVAIKWNGSTADIFVNGVKVIASTVFTGTTMQNLFGTGASIPFNIQQMALYPTPLTDDELITMTTI